MKKTKSKTEDDIFLDTHQNQNETEKSAAPLEYPSSFHTAFLTPALQEAGSDPLTATAMPTDTSEEANFFAHVIETTGQPFCAAFEDGRIKAYNLAFLNLLGYTAEEVRAVTWYDFVPSEWRERHAAAVAKVKSQDNPSCWETEYIRKDGSRAPVEVFLHSISGEDGKNYFCSFARDITERKRAGGELQNAADHVSNYVIELEQRNRETELFSEMVSLLQACVTLEEVQGVIGRLACELFATDAGALYLLNAGRTQFEPAAVWGENRPGEQPLQARECWSLRLGKMYLVDAHLPGVLCSHVKTPLETASLCIPLTAQGETLGLLHLLFNHDWYNLTGEARERQKRHKQQLAIAVAENIALSLANFKLRDTLYIQSIHDYLTGLYNRRYMAELLEKEIHRMARKKQPAGLIIIDIDRFKCINDRFGHEAGDVVLREFGLFLRKNIREEDFACRYGGDEFVIILPETSIENTRQRAEQLREGIKLVNFSFRSQRLEGVTLSLGVAVYPHHGLTAETLLRTADAALYRAKGEGRDRVVWL